MFLPAISLDKYVEYDFNYGYYNEDYKGYAEPIAKNITPTMMISTIFSQREDFYEVSAEYKQLEGDLVKKLEAGHISKEEFNKKLTSSSITSKYYAYSLYYGSNTNLNRLQPKMFLYAVLLLVFYCIVALTLTLNLINLFNPKKLLTIANVFLGWISVALIFIFNIFTFSLAVSSINHIKGFNGKIVEENTFCLAPKFLPIFLMFAYLAYAIISTHFEKHHAKIEKQNEEIPIELNLTINNQHKYRKINSKKSKYKHGSKKKRHN